MAEIITAENIKEKVFESEKTYLLDFWAEWCGPCMMLAEVIEGAKEELEGKVTIGKINVDEQLSLAQMFGISSIPALFIVKDGEVVDSAVGYMKKEALLQFIDKNI